MPGLWSYVGIDAGTSAVKVVVLGPDGNVFRQASAGYAVSAPRPGWAEGDPDLWWAALSAALSDLDAILTSAPPRAIGLCGQMHGVVLCDRAGAPSRPAVLWPDRRAEAELALWRGLPETDRARLANPIVTGMYAPALSWLAAHEPDAVSSADVALLPKDVLRMRLAGAAVTDRTDASATLLWDVVADRWAGDLAEHCGVPARLLPEVVRPDAVVGATSWPALARTGDDVPVVAGCADAAAAVFAAGDGAPLLVNLGTGAQVVISDVPARAAPDPVTHLYADAEGGWYAMAAVRNAGLALAWVCEVLGLGWAELVATIESQRPASTPAFLPFLTGERGGVAGPDSRGAWSGLSTGTTRADLARAAVESVAFAVRRAAELLPADLVQPLGQVRLTGGGSRDLLVQQLLADVLGRSVQRADVGSASATGAALLAARGVGDELVPALRTGPDLSPRDDPELAEAYLRWVDLATASG